MIVFFLLQTATKFPNTRNIILILLYPVLILTLNQYVVKKFSIFILYGQVISTGAAFYKNGKKSEETPVWLKHQTKPICTPEHPDRMYRGAPGISFHSNAKTPSPMVKTFRLFC